MLSSALSIRPSRNDSNRREQATPYWIYIVGIALALLVGAAAAVPKAFLALIVLTCVGAMIYGAVRSPWIALAVIVAQFPIIPTLRTLYTGYNLPVFAGGVRFFPDLLQYLILAQLLIRGAKDPRYRLRVFGDDLPVVVYILVGIYSVIVACQHVNPLAPLNGWYVSITPAIFYLVIRWWQPTREQSRSLIAWMTLCYLALAVPSFYAYIVRPEWYKVMMNAERSYYVVEGMSPMLFWQIYPRMQGFFFDGGIFWGTLSELVAVLAAAYLMRPGSPRRFYILLGVSVLGLLCSISRGAYISFALALTILLAHRGLHRKRILIPLIVLIGLATVSMATLRDIPLVNNVVNRLGTVGLKAVEKGEVANDRTHQWRNGWRVFVQMPSGSGLGTAGYGASLSKVCEYLVGDAMYFRILAEQGVIGIIAFAYFLVSVPWICWRYRHIVDEEWRPMGIGLMAFHIGLCVHGIGANTFDYYCIIPIYFMLFGFYVNAAHRALNRSNVLVESPASSPPLLSGTVN